MTTIKRIVARKVAGQGKYTHALYYVGTSLPKAWLYAGSYGWILYTIDGQARGNYETLERAKLRAAEFELL